ncbi:hypothetical protein PRZ48_013540 [Zasmidium cellare]|uniref:CFEM domain-containing protein n=1 Tax=Zasmidium cellare TaxID=395010 RepID=A0ABR0E1A5_ZASCE|nr:hypothetical protein PRZ48_013540 [Zasmidium cellare]
MQLFTFVAFMCGLATAQTTLTNTSQSAIDNSTDLPIPRCAQLCFAQVLPTYECSVSNVQCICPNTNLTSDVQACLYSNCTIPNQLLAEKFSKDTCGATSRNESGVTRRVTWVFFGFAVLFVVARAVARPQKLKGSGYGTDDWTILVCMALLLVLNVLAQTMTDHGLGADNYTLPADDITDMLKQFYVFEIFYTLIVMTTKVSILQLYLRIWTEEAVSLWFRRTCWSFIWILISTMFAFVVSLIFQCSPVSYAWTDWDGLHHGHCINRAGQIYALGAINIAYDVFVFVLPLHNFLKLNISWRRKMGVCLIFMVGLLVTVCSIVRLQYLVKVGLSSNPTWDYNATVIWSSIECNFSVICTCMPAMAGLLQRLWATMTGNPLSTSSAESKAPIKPEVIDPENPVSEDEILHMRNPRDSFSASATEVHETDPSAPTEKLAHSTTDGVEIKHAPPSETTATRMSYRDDEGRLHEVKVIDRPTSDVQPPDPEVQRATEQQREALRNLRSAREVEWRSEPSLQRDWRSEGPGRRF